MSWKTAHRSFYYQDAPEPEDIVLVPAATALLVIDIQNTYIAPKPDPADDARWQPFFERMRRTVIPNTARLEPDRSPGDRRDGLRRRRNCGRLQGGGALGAGDQSLGMGSNLFRGAGPARLHRSVGSQGL
jgi:hypothetical protein